MLNNRGLTLIEILISIAILFMALFPIYEFLRQGAISWNVGENKTEVVQNARISLDKLCDEIRHARELYTINSNEIRFWWKDLNENDTADSNEIITYYWSGTQGDDLQRKLDSETGYSPLANYIESFTLVYYDEFGNVTSQPDLVQLISADISIKKISNNQDYISHMRKSVHPRNMLL